MWFADLIRGGSGAKLSLGLLAVVLPSVAANGCGEVGKSAGSSPQASAPSTATVTTAPATGLSPAEASTNTGQISNKSAVDTDHDDHITEGYGHEASASDRRAVAAAVKAYYAVALAGEGARACSMMVSTLAKSVPEDYGRPPGPSALRGKTCEMVMTKLFGQQHGLLAREVPTMKVRKVRVNGNSILAFLAFKTTLEPREIGLDRKGGVWKVGALLDNSLP